MSAPSSRAIAAAVHAGQDPQQAVNEALIACSADRLNAVIRRCDEHAAADVNNLRTRLAAGERPPLAGVPVLIKDNICHRGELVGACSKILDGFRPPYDATVITRLKAAGAIVIGTTNMDEFAMGSSNETSRHGPVGNPHDPERIPGGSSGGSAAAVAAGYVPLALGSDTGGSIRQPAALCGCVGLKPSYGLVSRYGLLAFGSSLDQIGPFAGSVAEAADLLTAIAGPDPLDATSSPQALALPRLEGEPTAALKGLRVGWIPEHVEGLQPEVAERLAWARTALTQAGAELVEVHLPHERYAVAVYYVIATGEASSNLARYDGVHYGHRSATASSLSEVYGRSRAEGFGPEVQRRIMLGTYVLSAGYFDAYYKQAQRVRALICRDYQQAFAACDVILGPTSPTTAFKRGEKLADPLQMYLSDIFTIATNLAGVPGISVPCGFDSQGLPIGLQLQSPLFADHQLLRVAAGLEALAAHG